MLAHHRLPGPRDNLRPLFELAEDSAAELDSHIDADRVLIATSGPDVIGAVGLDADVARPGWYQRSGWA